MRTVQSRNFVVHLSCSLFNGAVVSAGKKKYMTLSGNSQEFSKIPHASCGSSTSREVLLLDPASSPLLDFHFKTLHTKLETLQRSQAAPLTPEQVLGTVKDYVRKQIFPSCSDPLLMQKLENMIEAARKDGHHEIAFNDTKPSVKIPIMSIEEFVQDGIGVCRHHGLVVSYLLDRLTQEPAGKPFLEGTVQHIRDNVPGGAHAWETFIPKAKAGMPAQKWHIDTLWNKLENFADAEAFNRLTRSYGDAMIRQQDRTKEAARINGQPLAVIDLSTGPALAKAVPADAQNRPKPAALTPIRPEPRYIHAQMMAVPADAKDNVKRIHRIHRPKPAALALISPIQLKAEADAQAPAAVTAPYAGALAAPVLTPRMPMALRAAAFQAADVSKPQKTAPEQSPGL